MRGAHRERDFHVWAHRRSSRDRRPRSLPLRAARTPSILYFSNPMAYYANLKMIRFARMSTRNVVLTDHQEKLIEGLVSTGRYQNASEVLREGLRLVERREEEDKARLKNLREAARVGIADIEGGRFRDFSSST